MPIVASGLKAGEVGPGTMKLVTIGEAEIVVANVDGQFCAFGNVCPHEGGPLVEGELDGGEVVCPWHYTRFDMRSGAALEGVTDEPIPVYEIRVEGDEIQIVTAGGA